MNKDQVNTAILTAQNQITTLYELFEFFFNNSKLLYHNGRLSELYYFNKKLKYSLLPNFKITYLRFSAHLNLECKNTHSAPRSGVENFIRKPELPLSYYGFKCNLYWQYEGEVPCFPSDIFKNTGIVPGSGGGQQLTDILRSYSSDSTTIWVDDWPKVEKSLIDDYVNEMLIYKLTRRSLPEVPVVNGEYGIKYTKE